MYCGRGSDAGVLAIPTIAVMAYSRHPKQYPACDDLQALIVLPIHDPIDVGVYVSKSTFAAEGPLYLFKGIDAVL